MNKYFRTVKSLVAANKNEFAIGATVLFGTFVIILAVILFVQNSATKIVYQPTSACSMFTLAEAKVLLGEKTLHSNAKDPALTGDTAASSCGYTDGNPDTENMKVAALIVRSAVNDSGIEKNRAEFMSGKPTDAVQEVKGLGDAAYFNERVGQLNILDKRDWIVISYGVGSTTQENTIEDAVKMAHMVLHQSVANGK